MATSSATSKGLSSSQTSLNSCVEVTEVQEELVTLNLRTKVAIGRFAEAEDDREMEEVNGEVREWIARFRKKLDRLRLLARKQERRRCDDGDEDGDVEDAIECLFKLQLDPLQTSLGEGEESS
jgi:hypothetical protein